MFVCTVSAGQWSVTVGGLLGRRQRHCHFLPFPAFPCPLSNLSTPRPSPSQLLSVDASGQRPEDNGGYTHHLNIIHYPSIHSSVQINVHQPS